MKLNPDSLTTIFGLILAALIAESMDWAKVLVGDRMEIAKILAAIVIGLNGWFTNRKPKGKE